MLSDKRKWEIWKSVSNPNACLDAMILAYGNAVAEAAVQDERDAVGGEAVMWIENSFGSVSYNPIYENTRKLPEGVRFYLYTRPQASATVPEGWKLVPIEPTREMWAAVNKLDDEMAAGSYDGNGCTIEQAWHCLLANSPPAASQPDVGKEGK